MLEDIAVLTGGTVISEDTGRKLENVTVAECGQARRVWADKDKARIIDGKGDKKLIQARISQIRRELENTTSDFDKEKLQERLAKLSGGVAVIKVGAASEIELKEKKHRLEDAVAATKAAIEEGIVAGGGVTLLKVRSVLAAVKKEMTLDDEKVGVDILNSVLKEPFLQLVANSGEAEKAGYLLHEIETSKEANYGYDVLNRNLCDLVKLGVVDPAKVEIAVVNNAVSVAGMILTTECLITDIPEKNPPAPPMPGGGMDY